MRDLNKGCCQGTSKKPVTKDVPNKNIEKTPRTTEQSCCDELEEKPAPSKCPPRKTCPKLAPASKPLKKIVRDDQKAKVERVFARIQPAVEDREPYRKLRHIKNIVDEAASTQLVTLYKPRVCPAQQKAPETCGDGQKEGKKVKKSGKQAKKLTGGESEKSKEGEESNAAAKKTENGDGTEGENDEEKKAKEKEAKRRERKEQDKYWCQQEEIVEVVSQHWTPPPFIRNCDTVCSFDSRIDLAGLGLTKEEKAKIEENRRRLHPPQGEQSTEKEISNDADNTAEEPEEEQVEIKEEPEESDPVDE